MVAALLPNDHHPLPQDWKRKQSIVNMAQSHHNASGQAPPPPGGHLPPTSSTNRHHHHYHHHHPSPLEPVSGKLLFEQECRRRDGLRARGPLATSCGEVDDRALGAGGFERGCVVGISAAEAEDGGGDGGEEEVEEEVALVMGLQTIARMLVDAWQRGMEEGEKKRRGGRLPRAMIISTAGVGTLVGVLRDVLRAQIASLGALVEGGEEGRKGLLRELLGRIAISRVFDVPGLWEALGELDSLPPSQELGEEVMTMSGGVREDEAVLGDVARAEALEDATLPDAPPEQLYDVDNGPPEDTAQQTPLARQGDTAAPQADEAWSSSPLSDPPSSLPDEAPWETTEIGGETVLSQRPTPPGQREEIQDSEEEDEGFSSPMAPSLGSPETSPVKIAKPDAEEGSWTRAAPGDKEVTIQAEHSATQGQHDIGQQQEECEAVLGETSAAQAAKAQKDRVPHVANPADSQDSKHPDIILITHMSTLLSSLFHQREKSSAHEMLQLLASHLRYLSRAPEHGGPLVMILNSTSSLEATALETTTTNQQAHEVAPPPGPPPGAPPTPGKRSLDPTLRSIFNPPPPPASRPLSYAYRHDTPHARRNKPSFGLVFSQLLDVHLLCTRVPRRRADAEEALYAWERGTAGHVDYAWVVEVLLDEIGVWEGSGTVVEGVPRRSREQRWGAVVVRREAGGVRMVDASERKGDEGEVRIALAGGFGGRRV